MNTATKQSSPSRTPCKHRILIVDGAMGTMIQAEGLQEADYRGERFADHPSDLKGNNDLLCLTRPDVIGKIHRPTWMPAPTSSRPTLSTPRRVAQDDYDLGELASELNLAGARIAREAVDRYCRETPDRPRFVAAFWAPPQNGLHLPGCQRSRGPQHHLRRLAADYAEATRALIEGGVDLIMIETIFDTLNAKAAIFAVQEVFEELGVNCPS